MKKTVLRTAIQELRGMSLYNSALLSLLLFRIKVMLNGLTPKS